MRSDVLTFLGAVFPDDAISGLETLGSDRYTRIDACLQQNFGNFLFLWDVLLGTAHITRRYPEKVGLQDDLVYGQERWYHQMFFPLLQSKREHSALRIGGRVVAEEETRSDGPAPQQT